MEKRTIVTTIFNVLSFFIVLVSLRLLVSAFLSTGFRGICPLWGRGVIVFLLFWMFAANRIKRVILQFVENQITRSKLDLYIMKFIIILIALMIGASFWHYYVRQQYLQKLFIAFFPNSEAKQVKLVKGNAFAWQGWNAGLVFSSDQDTFNQIIKDYEIVPCDNLIANYFGEEIVDDSKVCYYKKVLGQSGKIYTEYQITWVKSKGLAYCHASDLT